jgi:hypothetical protein
MKSIIIATVTIISFESAPNPDEDRAEDKKVLNTHAKEASPLAFPSQLNAPVQ